MKRLYYFAESYVCVDALIVLAYEQEADPGVEEWSLCIVGEQQQKTEA